VHLFLRVLQILDIENLNTGKQNQKNAIISHYFRGLLSHCFKLWYSQKLGTERTKKAPFFHLKKGALIVSVWACLVWA